METLTYPYKLQVFLTQSLRQSLKNMAHEKGTSLQDLVTTVLAEAVHHHDAHKTQDQARPRREATPA